MKLFGKKSTDEKRKSDKHQVELTAALELHVRLEAAFKYMSYRITTPEAYIQEAKELVSFFNYSIESVKDDIDPNQMSVFDEQELKN